MSGLFKRKGSDVWQGRYRVPSDLWTQRGRLAELGVKDLPKAQEHGRSTGEDGRDAAGEAYRAALVAWDAKMAAWRSLLADGPQRLTQKQQVALAADHAKAFLAANEDNPSDAPLPPALPELPDDGEAAWGAMLRQMAPAERTDLARDLKAFIRATGVRRKATAFALLKRYPALGRVVASDLADGLEAMHGADTDAAVAVHGLHVDSESRRLLNLEMASFMGAAQRGLEAMQDGNYTPVQRLAAAPAFTLTKRASLGTGDPKFTFKGIVEAETSRRAKGKDAKPFPQASVRKYSKRGREFADWRKAQGLSGAAANDARTVTRDEAERWREALLATGEFTNRTINDKLASISTIIRWGRRLLREDFHPDGNPLKDVEKLDFTTLDSDARTYRLEEAIKVLEATRKEAEVRRRWLPWICAYTGMRIEEAGQLEVADFFRAGGRWFLRVSTSGRRSLKTASSQRRIPVHPSLEREGLIAFVQSLKAGPLFKSRRIQPVMSEWVRETVGITRPELSPNHGWRHFFEDLCARANMPDAARDYVTGRASGKSREVYGRSELMLPGLAEAMDRVPDILSLR